MTKWQHFKHAFGKHDWHKTADYNLSISVKRCGPYDPSDGFEEKPFVNIICCQCGEERKAVPYLAWLYMK